MVITLFDVLMNLDAYRMGVSVLGELPDSDGIYSMDAPEEAAEHETRNEVGRIEDPACLKVKLRIPKNRVVLATSEVRPYTTRKTRTILAVRGAHVDGVYHDTVYIKAIAK